MCKEALPVFISRIEYPYEKRDNSCQQDAKGLNILLTLGCKWKVSRCQGMLFIFIFSLYPLQYSLMSQFFPVLSYCLVRQNRLSFVYVTLCNKALKSLLYLMLNRIQG